jgi:hypothetical protein
MHAIGWMGIVLLALGVLAYVVFKVAVWVAIALFIAGVLLMIWGAVKIKRAV